MTATAARLEPDPEHALFSARCGATNAEVGAMLAALQDELGARLVDPARTSDVMIVLGEVLNNTVEHAMAGRDDGWIALTVHEAGGRLEVRTSDDGRPVPPGLIAGGAASPELGDDVDALPEGGFGWFLIHSLVDDLTYERADGVNAMSFSF